MKEDIIVLFSTRVLPSANTHLAALERGTRNGVLGFLLNTRWVPFVF